MNQRDTLITWLNDAYGVEQNSIKLLESRAYELRERPRLQGRVEHHLEETRRHVLLIEQCVRDLGGRTSAIKLDMGAIGKTVGFTDESQASMSDDNLIRSLITDYSAEHTEIATYQSIIAAAESLGETRIAQACREILHDEEDMAEWIEQQLPVVANQCVLRHPVT